MTRRQRRLHAWTWFALGPLLLAATLAGLAARKRVPFEGAPRKIQPRATETPRGEGRP